MSPVTRKLEKRTMLQNRNSCANASCNISFIADPITIPLLSCRCGEPVRPKNSKYSACFPCRIPKPAVPVVLLHLSLYKQKPHWLVLVSGNLPCFYFNNVKLSPADTDLCVQPFAQLIL